MYNLIICVFLLDLFFIPFFHAIQIKITSTTLTIPYGVSDGCSAAALATVSTSTAASESPNAPAAATATGTGIDTGTDTGAGASAPVAPMAPTAAFTAGGAPIGDTKRTTETAAEGVPGMGRLAPIELTTHNTKRQKESQHFFKNKISDSE